MRNLIVALGCVLLLLSSADTHAITKTERTALSGRSLSVNELYHLYGNKSWIWEKGAGHFAKSKRRFTAIISVKKREYGIGNWYMPGKGKVCFRALWYTGKQCSRSVTCFSHRLANGNIYQKREPKGEWYIFKHRRSLAGDEYRKLRRGNFVKSRLRKAQRR